MSAQLRDRGGGGSGLLKSERQKWQPDDKIGKIIMGEGKAKAMSHNQKAMSNQLMILNHNPKAMSHKRSR